MTYAIPAWDAPDRAGGRQRATSFPSATSIASGRNYAEHAKEMGGDATKEPPFFFTKPADAIVPVVPPGGRAASRYPLATKNFHHEIELVVAIGKARRQRRAPSARTRWCSGYAVGLDMTRRDLQNDMREKKRPWDIGKSFAQAAPIAPIHPRARRRAISRAARSASTSTARGARRAISPT